MPVPDVANVTGGVRGGGLCHIARCQSTTTNPGALIQKDENMTYIVANLERSRPVIACSAQLLDKMVPDAPEKASDPDALLAKGFGRVEWA